MHPDRGRRVLSFATLIALCSVVLAACGTQVAPATDVPQSAAGVRPLLPGMAAPDFVARRPDGSEFRFNPEALDKPVVLSFYRGGWCPYCNRQLAGLRKAEKQLTGMGFDVLFLSADRPDALLPSLKQGDLGYTLLSDNSMSIARAFGVAFVVDAATRERYLTKNIDLEAASGMDHHQLPVPATFLIGTDGLIHFQYANPNYKVRLQPDLLETAAKLYMVSLYAHGGADPAH